MPYKPDIKPNSSRERNGACGLNQRGSVIIMVAVAIFAMFSFAVLAIDAPILMTTRNQLQAAADAAALAGASGLWSTQSVATGRALDFASYNTAVQDVRRPVLIDVSDVSFPEPNIIRVQTHRTAATGDALRTYFLRFVNPTSSNTADMTAVAAARAFDVCGADCLKPWAIPDRWDDADSSGTYTPGDYYHPDSTGYLAPRDVGTVVDLKIGNPQNAIKPGLFFPVDFPPLGNEEGESPLTGGAWYEQWIGQCAPYTVEPGDSLQVEPGNMVGPTMHGMEDLYDLDPGAYWDDVNKVVVGSNYGWSPRIGLVPFFDPRFEPESGRSVVHVTKIGAIFIDSVGPGSKVTGRFIQVTSAGTPCNGELGTSFIKGIVLIE